MPPGPKDIDIPNKEVNHLNFQFVQKHIIRKIAPLIFSPKHIRTKNYKELETDAHTITDEK